jgi:hypothetical protein
MMLRKTQLHFAAALLAMALFSLTGLSARAFTTENLNGSPDGNARYADPDDAVKNFGQRSGFSFQAGSPSFPFAHGPGAGFAPSAPPPRPYDLTDPNRE